MRVYPFLHIGLLLVATALQLPYGLTSLPVYVFRMAEGSLLQELPDVLGPMSLLLIIVRHPIERGGPGRRTCLLPSLRSTDASVHGPARGELPNQVHNPFEN